MLYFLCFLCSYFKEYFTDRKLTQWQITSDAKNKTVQECSASHQDLTHYCFSLNDHNSSVILQSKKKMNIDTFPILVYFTTHSTSPAPGSKIFLNLYHKNAKRFSIGYKFDSFPEYELKDNDDAVLSNGTLTHEPYLSHSIATVFRKNNDYELYVDGMILGNGTLSEVLPIDQISIEIETKNNSLEIGNLLITKSLHKRWQILVTTLLRLRKVERTAYLDRLVDQYEDELFDGMPFADKIVDEGEQKDELLLSESDANPRRFNFPFKLPEKLSETDPLYHMRKEELKKKEKEHIKDEAEYSEDL